jgi:hypothetical protein
MRKRRWLQIRLGTLFALLTLCAVAFAWWAKWRSAMRQEAIALAAIRDENWGYVFFAEHWDMAGRRPLSYAAEPRRTVADYILARNALHRVVAVSYNTNVPHSDDPFGVFFATPSQIPDASLDSLKRFPNLRWLEFSQSSVTDEQLSCLPQFPKVEVLELELPASETEKRDLACIARFPGLRSLSLSGINFTDSSLANLAPLTSLEELDLSYTSTTTQHLVYLNGLKKLRRLNLIGTQVTRIGVYRLRKELPKLEILTPFDEEE